MKKLLCSAAALAISVAPATAQDEVALADIFDLNTITRVLIDMGVLALRSQVDVTYEGVSVSRGGNEISLVGVNLYPVMVWDINGLCEIEIARLDMSNAGTLGESKIHLEAIGTRVTPACLPPEALELVAATGYEMIAVDRLFVDFDFDVGSSALDVAGHLALRDAAVIDVAASFDYFWFRDTGYGEPDPAMLLSSAVVSIEDLGLLDRVKPMVPPGQFDLATAGQMITQQLENALSQGGFAPVTPDGSAFAAAAGEAVGAFLNDGAGRISVTVRPDEPIWIGPDSFGGPGDMIAAFSPSITAGEAPGAADRIDPELLALVLGGGAASPDDMRRTGLALLNGVGAPYAPAAGRSILASLPGDDPEIALALARSFATSDEEAAYGYALDAAAAGAKGALALLDRIETGLSSGTILSIQGRDIDRLVEAAQSAGDLRDAALRAMSGIGERRSYASAYVLASLAAAAGDLSSAGLRDRIGQRMRSHDASGAWADEANALDGAVLDIWLGGLGARVGSSGGGAGGGSGGWGTPKN